MGKVFASWRVTLGLVALGAAVLVAIALPVVANGDDATPTWKLRSFRSRGWDRSFKLTVAEEMPQTPRVIVFGGSRALRMDPSLIKRRTGLPAFNFAFHNGRPEDAWAVTDWLIDNHPDEPPAVIWCLQATTLADVPMAPGLIVDERLSQAFPKALVKAKMAKAMREPIRNAVSGRRYGFDGMLYWNGYDRKRKEGLTLERSLTQYLDAGMLAKAGNHKIPGHTRAKAYFKRTLRLLNRNHIKPVIVIMPYHPRALQTFMSVGWGVKQTWLRNYLKRLRKYYDFRVLDCLTIKSFGGSPSGFYDGSHLTAGNSRRLLRYIISKAPSCFRVPMPVPTPSPTPTVSPSPSASPQVAPPKYVPVPEDTSAPADLLE